MFGDVNDENSEIAKWRANERNYFLLEDLGVKPTVSYLVKVRNQEEAILEAKHHGTEKHGDHKEVKTEEKHA